MSGAFVSQLRANRPSIVMAQGPDTITFRVEASDIWDAVRVIARPDTLIAEMKRRVVDEFFHQPHPEEHVLKLHGWEILNEQGTLQEVGIGVGSIVLLAYRRRRPVR